MFLTGGNDKTRGRSVVQTVKPAISRHPGPLAKIKYKHASFYSQENGVETFESIDLFVRSLNTECPLLGGGVWGGGGVYLMFIFVLTRLL